jgi:hypothetical protein
MICVLRIREQLHKKNDGICPLDVGNLIKLIPRLSSLVFWNKIYEIVCEVHTFSEIYRMVAIGVPFFKQF